jgi:hypothetical protein
MHGSKSRSCDGLSTLGGVGTGSAGKAGTAGKRNDGGRDGGIGLPDFADSGP